MKFRRFIGFAILLSLAIVIVWLSASTLHSTAFPGDAFEHNHDSQFQEWISPDGVHYWYYTEPHLGMLAPRYDAEGNLVVSE